MNLILFINPWYKIWVIWKPRICTATGVEQCHLYFHDAISLNMFWTQAMNKMNSYQMFHFHSRKKENRQCIQTLRRNRYHIEKINDDCYNLEIGKTCIKDGAIHGFSCAETEWTTISNEGHWIKWIKQTFYTIHVIRNSLCLIWILQWNTQNRWSTYFWALISG